MDVLKRARPTAEPDDGVVQRSAKRSRSLPAAQGAVTPVGRSKEPEGTAPHGRGAGSSAVAGPAAQCQPQPGVDLGLVDFGVVEYAGCDVAAVRGAGGGGGTAESACVTIETGASATCTIGGRGGKTVVTVRLHDGMAVTYKPDTTQLQAQSPWSALHFLRQRKLGDLSHLRVHAVSSRRHAVADGVALPARLHLVARLHVQAKLLDLTNGDPLQGEHFPVMHTLRQRSRAAHASRHGGDAAWPPAAPLTDDDGTEDEEMVLSDDADEDAIDLPSLYRALRQPSRADVVQQPAAYVFPACHWSL